MGTLGLPGHSTRWTQLEKEVHVYHAMKGLYFQLISQPGKGWHLIIFMKTKRERLQGQERITGVGLIYQPVNRADENKPHVSLGWLNVSQEEIPLVYEYRIPREG